MANTPLVTCRAVLFETAYYYDYDYDDDDDYYYRYYYYCYYYYYYYYYFVSYYFCLIFIILISCQGSGWFREDSVGFWWFRLGSGWVPGGSGWVPRSTYTLHASIVWLVAPCHMSAVSE